MTNKENRKPEGPEVNEEEENEMEENENKPQETEGKVVQLPTEKKGGFLRDLGVGAKIGVALVFTGIGIGVGFLVKALIGGKEDENAPIQGEGSVSDPVE